MDALLEKLVEENRPFTREGRVAGYIPELAKADRDELGICVVSSDGRISSAGEYRRTFTIQSIIKPILLLLALMDNGEDTVRARVGVEATGKPFDAINYTDQALLSEHLNPMVNMGAILLCTLIHGTSYSQRLERLLELTRRLAGNPSLSVDEAVYRSEKQTGSRNRAMAFLLESCGLLHDDPGRCWTVISGPAPSGWTAGTWPISPAPSPAGAAAPPPASGCSPPDMPTMSTPC